MNREFLQPYGAGGIATAALVVILPCTAWAAPPLKLGDADVVPCGGWEIWTTLDFEVYELAKDDKLNFRLGFKYRFAEWGETYLAAGRSFLPAEDNRPRFDLSTGLMLEF